MRNKDKQVAVYNFIVRYYADYGYTPTVIDIMRGAGIASSSTVVLCLRELSIWGWIRRVPYAKRTIVINRPTERGLSPDQLKALLS